MANVIEINKKDLSNAIDLLEEAEEAFGERWLKNTLARNARRDFVPEMQRASVSTRLVKMISVTQAKKFTGGGAAVRTGVVKNDTDLFPDISAQALASILEHGTKERFRELTTLGIVTGRVSTGRVKPMSGLRAAYDKKRDVFISNIEKSIEKKFEKETR